MSVFRLMRSPDDHASKLLVTADSEHHAIAVAQWQLRAQGMRGRWPVNDEPVYAEIADQ